MTRKRQYQSQFHRSQIGRAQRYIRLHMAEPLTLGQIAREAGSSSYHFARVFQAYTGETPFEFLRRIRVAAALRVLREDANASVTEIALSIGYDTSAAFNKSLRKALDLTPSQFRNLGKEQQERLIYDLNQSRQSRVISVNLIPEFDIVARPETKYVFVERRGPFAEVAPALWDEFLPMSQRFDHGTIREYLGMSGVDESRTGEDSLLYRAGIAVVAKVTIPRCLREQNIQKGKYARFLLTGPYEQIWEAFDQVFTILAEKKLGLRSEFCIENYLNDPRVTFEDELKTELLIPIA